MLEASLAGAAVTERRHHVSGIVERHRSYLVQEEIADAEADAVLRLAASIGDDKKLRITHVLDAVAVVGELRTELPHHATSLEHTGIERELVTPAFHASDVDDLIAGESGRGWNGDIDDRVGDFASVVRVREIGVSAEDGRLETQLELAAPFGSELWIADGSGHETGTVLIAHNRVVESRRVEGAGLRTRSA